MLDWIRWASLYSKLEGRRTLVKVPIGMKVSFSSSHSHTSSSVLVFPASNENIVLGPLNLE